MTIPGIGERAAQTIIAEIGVDMSRFPTADHLASWAGLCPGNNESAGKRKKTTTRNGNAQLCSVLVESAWAVSRTQTRLGARFRRLHRRFGKAGGKKAAVAVAHTHAGDRLARPSRSRSPTPTWVPTSTPSAMIPISRRRGWCASSRSSATTSRSALPPERLDSSRVAGRVVGSCLVSSESAKDRMDIISAYQQVGSYRAAAELCGTTHKTVKRVVDKFEGRRRAAAPRVERAHNYDAVADLVAERVEKSRGSDLGQADVADRPRRGIRGVGA